MFFCQQSYGTDEMFIETICADEITAFVGKRINTEDEPFKKQFILMRSQLNESDWEVLERVAKVIMENKYD